MHHSQYAPAEHPRLRAQQAGDREQRHHRRARGAALRASSAAAHRTSARNGTST